MIELSEAVGILFRPENLIYAVIGFLVGTFGGMVPGIGGALTLTLIMPFTLAMTPESSVILLAGAYTGVMYGGSIPAILINTPGTSSSAATALDGYEMAKQGKAVTAISISATASAMGSFIGGIFLIAISPILIAFVLAFGSPEFFMLAIVGLSIIVLASSGSMMKGLIAGTFGALIATIGSTVISAERRYTFGIPELYGGINLLAVFIGVFAVAEMLRLAGQGGSIADKLAVTGSRLEGVRETLRNWRTVIKGSMIGIFVGTVPGEGGAVANFLSYLEAKRSSNDPQRFGKGHPAGVVAPEASNNSVISGSLVPTLSFGIPGSSTTAVLLGGLLLQGLRPGPSLFDEDIIVTYTLFGSVLVGSVLTFIIGVGLASWFGLVPSIPNAILIPSVIFIAFVGAFVAEFNFGDVWQTLFFGFVGYGLIRFGFPVIAFILGIILGPLAEENLYRTYQITGGDLSTVFFTRPLSLIMVILTVTLLAWPLVGTRIKPVLRAAVRKVTRR
jgi:putative tricarboxylic transport membrane protein